MVAVGGSATQKIASLSQAKDPKQAIIESVGDLSKVDVFFNQILIATYIRSEKTAGGIIRPQSNLQEDIWQGKVALVLKKGPQAFQDDAEVSFDGQDVEVGDWVVIRVGDGWACNINNVGCRVVTDRNIRLRVKDPSVVW